MQMQVGNSTIELIGGDITEQQVDAIVNAANSRLSGGGGVDGAIHRKGGPAIMQETDRLYPKGCLTGSAVISGAGNLPAKFVIHAVGPIWSGGNLGEDGLLRGAFRKSLELAVEHDCKSVAMPALSAGVYRFPVDEVAEIALETTIKFIHSHGAPQLVRFVLFNAEVMSAFIEAMDQARAAEETG